MEWEQHTAPGLEFRFPGWESRLGQSMEVYSADNFIRDIDDLEDCQEESEQGDNQAPEEEVDSRFILDLPDHLLLRILGRLDIPDTLSLSQSCRCLHRLAIRNELWQERSGKHQNSAQLPALTPLSDLRWLAGNDSAGTVIVRSNRAAAREQQVQVLRQKFLAVACGVSGEPDEAGEEQPGVQLYLAQHLRLADAVDAKLLSLWRSHLSLRTALCEMWLGGPVEASWLRSIICQLTRFSWSHCYEALGNAFKQVCDAAALQLHQREHATWEHVLQLWQRYSGWLDRVCVQCDLLSQCVSAERTAEWMARGRYDTPSITDAAAAAFRSKVLLRFGPRRDLQERLVDLAATAAAQQHARLLSRVRALLAKLDVPDDGTANRVHHTRQTFREAYGLEAGPALMRMDGSLSRY